jgi:hypothetical protein
MADEKEGKRRRKEEVPITLDSYFVENNTIIPEKSPYF